MRRLNRLHRNRRITAVDYNNLVDEINRVGNVYASGRNVRVSRGPLGTHINFIDTGDSGGTSVYIASVDQSDAGGGYYTCDIQKLDAGAKWEDDGSDILADNTSDVTIFNLAEHEASTHNLAKSDLMVCWQEEDSAAVSDAGSVYVGFPIVGSSGMRRAKTTSGWTAGTTTGANLLDSGGTEITTGYGSGITVNFFKSYSANNYPVIANDETIPVYQDVNGNWYCPYTFNLAQTLTAVYDVDFKTPDLTQQRTKSIMVFDDGTLSDLDTVFTGTACP